MSLLLFPPAHKTYGKNSRFLDPQKTLGIFGTEPSFALLLLVKSGNPEENRLVLWNLRDNHSRLEFPTGLAIDEDRLWGPVGSGWVSVKRGS